MRQRQQSQHYNAQRTLFHGPNRRDAKEERRLGKSVMDTK
jgi:hypothetical protein